MYGKDRSGVKNPRTKIYTVIDKVNCNKYILQGGKKQFGQYLKKKHGGRDIFRKSIQNLDMSCENFIYELEHFDITIFSSMKECEANLLFEYSEYTILTSKDIRESLKKENK